MFSFATTPVRYYSLLRSGLLGLCCLVCCAACGTANWLAPLKSPGESPQPSSPDRQSIDPNQPVYRVQSGDTLSGIAWRSQQSLHQIAQLNNLRPPYIIRIGQMLRLRPSSSASSTPSKPRPSSKPSPQPAIRSSLQWAWPVSGTLFSAFKAGDAVRKGIKISAKLGSPVRAAEAGRVVYSGSGLIGYGPLIIIKHNDDFLSAYGHNRKLLVSTGQQITKGQTIAELGAANSGKALLHFEIRHKGKPINPLRLLPSR